MNEETLFERMAACQTDLEVAGQLLTAASTANAADKADEAFRAPVLQLVSLAKERLRRAVDALWMSNCESHLVKLGNEVQRHIYPIYSTLCFATDCLELKREQPQTQGMTDAPLSDLIGLCARLVGTDCDKGVPREVEQILVEISTRRLPKAA